MSAPYVKFCGITRQIDIEYVNILKPDYIGFVFAKKSRRYIEHSKALVLRKMLESAITPVGVFVNEAPENVAKLVNDGVIDIAQLHGSEDEQYIAKLRSYASCPIIKAFNAAAPGMVEAAAKSSADYVLIDSGEGGTGTAFDWCLLKTLDRPFFLAGGLSAENVTTAIAAAAAAAECMPYAVDVSSGIETDRFKDPAKMHAFVMAVRGIGI